MRYKKIKQCIAMFFAVLILCLSLPLNVFADTLEGDWTSIDETDVLTDLNKFGWFSTNDYTVQADADWCELIEFIEFGYDYWGNAADYGLYVYVYNPSCKEIDVTGVLSYKNAIQIRAALAGGKSETSWRKEKLKHISHTNDFMFYKFKVDVPSSFMKEPTKNQRIYEISDMEFIYSGKTSAISVGAGGVWSYTGYQEYHGADRAVDVSTLYWESDELLTLELEINDASWKTKTSDKGVGYQHEMSSVYFSVPDRIIDKYGNADDAYKGLREVSGYYKNYKLRGISTPNTSFYNEAKGYVGLSASSSDIPFGFCTEPIGALITGVTPYIEFLFNPTSSSVYFHKINHRLGSFGNVFQGTLNGITNESLLEQVYEYRNEGKLLLSYGSYTDNYYTVKSEDGDLGSAMASFSSANGTSWFKAWALGEPTYVTKEEYYEGIDALTVVDEAYVAAYTDTAVGEKYFICEEDSGAFKNYVTSNSLGHTTFLMRFAITDYYCDDIDIFYHDHSDEYDFESGNLYFEKEIFLDFDILSLTWERANGTRHVLPVTATPIDIVGSVTPVTPGKDKDGDKDDRFGCGKIEGLEPIILIVGVLAIIVLINFVPGLSKVFDNILNALFKILLLPFKGIAWLLEKIFVPDHAKKTEYKYKKKLEESKEDKKEEK